MLEVCEQYCAACESLFFRENVYAFRVHLYRRLSRLCIKTQCLSGRCHFLSLSVSLSHIPSLCFLRTLRKKGVRKTWRRRGTAKMPLGQIRDVKDDSF